MAHRKTVLITGANRGIGLALARGYLACGWTVFACARKDCNSKVFKALLSEYPGTFDVLRLDVSEEKSISRAARTMSSRTKHLDLLINNAGICFDKETISEFDAKKAAWSFAVNATGPMLVVKNFLPLLRKGQDPKVVNISSLSGSISRVSGFSGYYTYKASKAALNMFSRLLGHELRKHGIATLIVHPGLVKTRMNPAGAISPEKSASGIMAAVEKTGLRNSGIFVSPDSKGCPW